MPVLITRAEGQSVGVVASVDQVGDVVYCGVSLEDATVKGVPGTDLEPATPDTVRAVLGWLVRDPEFQASMPGEGPTQRQLFLRSRYMEELREALAYIERGEGAASASTPFEPGTAVALREGLTWHLGIMQGARSVSGKTSCVVEVTGDVRQVPLEEVHELGEAPQSPAGLALGARVRFVVPGHENDDDYLATICSVCAEGEPSFAIAFDDEDVLEDLGEDDIVLA